MRGFAPLCFLGLFESSDKRACLLPKRGSSQLHPHMGRCSERHRESRMLAQCWHGAAMDRVTGLRSTQGESTGDKSLKVSEETAGIPGVKTVSSFQSLVAIKIFLC